MSKFIKEKSQEISFAVLRVAAYVRRFDLRKKLEELSYHLIENIYYGNEELSLSTISTIEGFLTLSRNVYEIEPINYKILMDQLAILRRELLTAKTATAGVSIDDIFKAKNEEAVVPAIRQNREYGNNVATEPSASTSDRQKAIVSAIRQFAGMKMQLKDIVPLFPGVSSRTLRYDLKQLCERGELVREGNGGPSNFYGVKGV